METFFPFPFFPSREMETFLPFPALHEVLFFPSREMEIWRRDLEKEIWRLLTF